MKSAADVPLTLPRQRVLCIRSKMCHRDENFEKSRCRTSDNAALIYLLLPIISFVPYRLRSFSNDQNE